MSSTQFTIRQCSNPHCRFRFPIHTGESIQPFCPKCGSLHQEALPPYSNNFIPPQNLGAKFTDCSVLLDNVRSAMNVGSIFRSCDCLGVKQVFLCGITPTPENPKVTKTALASETTLRWSYHLNSLDQARWLKDRGMSLFALETTPDAIPLQTLIAQPVHGPITLICGNERAGIDPEVLLLCDKVVYLPLLGVKSSMNVAVAVGAALVALHTAPWV